MFEFDRAGLQVAVVAIVAVAVAAKADCYLGRSGPFPAVAKPRRCTADRGFCRFPWAIRAARVENFAAPSGRTPCNLVGRRTGGMESEPRCR